MLHSSVAGSEKKQLWSPFPPSNPHNVQKEQQPESPAHIQSQTPMWQTNVKKKKPAAVFLCQIELATGGKANICVYGWMTKLIPHVEKAGREDDGEEEEDDEEEEEEER